ncbi:MAG TPA: lipoprotein insertase outer membrane protein LolB [Steroidobacteraceae bacterium]|nr:lipoprotein insertase outer membrane protein LolB [Steroidobacteraceae bacterium]
MPLRCERWRAAGGACLTALLLAGCATRPVQREPMPAAAQQRLLQSIEGFHLQGRAAVTAGQQGFTATLAWTQHAGDSSLRLSGLLGGGLAVQYSATALHVISSHGGELRDADAEQMLVSELGFVPPFAALRYWVLGLAAPGDPPQEVAADAAGGIAAMTQQGWRLVYDRWVVVDTSSGPVRLPQRVSASRDQLHLKLVVDRWQLQPGS